MQENCREILLAFRSRSTEKVERRTAQFLSDERVHFTATYLHGDSPPFQENVSPHYGRITKPYAMGILEKFVSKLHQATRILGALPFGDFHL